MDGGFAPGVYNTTLPDAPDPARAGSQPHTPQPLTESSFTGMLNTSDAHLTHSYRYTPMSSESGHTNAAAQGKLYNRRLEAQLALNQRSAAEGNSAKAWNERRAAAIARGEDPNSALIEAIEKRPPNSFLERGWRKLRGKPPTKYEERMEKERKEREKQAEMDKTIGVVGGDDAAFEKGRWEEKVRESESDEEGETQKQKRKTKRKEAEDGVIR